MEQAFGLTELRSVPAENICDPTYEATQESYWSLQESSLSPACILTPDSAQDVSEAISIVAGIESCRFAIKGQGHAPAAGFANVNAGITIDMTGLNSVVVNTDQSIASVGAGASWLDVYTYLDTLGLSVAGARNGAVGVGGLVLGGGISYFAPRKGFACDTVINFEIVLATGEVANANAASRPDLFRALKGGANNFGVVTRIDLIAFPQGQISVSSFVQTISNRQAVFKAFADIAGAPYYDPYASLVTSLVFNATSKVWITSTAAIYTKPVLYPAVYGGLRGIPSLVNSSKITNLSTFANEKPTPPLNWLFFTSTYAVSAPLLSKIFDISNTTLFDFNVPHGIIWSIAFEPLPTIAVQYGDLRGGNSLGTTPKDGNGVVLLLTALFPPQSTNTTATNAQVHTLARSLLATINTEAEKMNLLHKFQYLNYADASQDPIGSYGEENIESMRAVSKNYDRGAIFQKQAPGGFKIPQR